MPEDFFCTRSMPDDARIMQYDELQRDREEIVRLHKAAMETKKFLLQYGQNFGKHHFMYAKIYCECEEAVVLMSEIREFFLYRIMNDSDSDEMDEL